MQPVWSDDSLFDRRQWLKYGALLGSTLGGLAASGQAGCLCLLPRARCSVPPGSTG